jgi:glucokinase
LEHERWRPRFSCRYLNADYGHFGAILKAFLGKLKASTGGPARIDHGCLAVAGPVQDQYAELTNLPWQINAAARAQEFRIAKYSGLRNCVWSTTSKPLLPVVEPQCVLAGPRFES